MNVFIFEWLNGGGLWVDDTPPSQACHFIEQGRAMLDALTLDFQSALHSVQTLSDIRLVNPEATLSAIEPSAKTIIDGSEELVAQLKQRAAESHAIVLIAPESNECLERCLQWLAPWNEKIISPNLDFVRASADKNLTEEILSKAHVRTPKSIEPSDFAANTIFVAKPVDGAGSEGIKLIAPSSTSQEQISSLIDKGFRVEEFIPGKSASVSVLCGLESHRVLHPTWQILEHSCGAYQSSEKIKCRNTIRDIQATAQLALSAMPATVGYVGIDIIVADDGTIHVVDVNPRLTASYCKLREIEDFNIADEMLRLATLHRPGKPSI